MAWLRVSKAPEMTWGKGTDMAYMGSRKAKSAWAPQSAPLIFLSSWVMTAPLFISEPVPNTVTMVTRGMNSVGRACFVYCISQMSSSSLAWADTILQQSDTEPPPTARIRSTWFSLANFAPSCTLA